MDRPTILVVEDEILIRIDVAELLREAGYQVLEASNGHEGLTILGTSQTIHLVLSDVEMPGQLDGLQLVLEAKKLHPDLPVALVSSHLPAQAGCLADEFIAKPYVASLLLAVVEKLIGQEWQNQRQDLTG